MTALGRGRGGGATGKRKHKPLPPPVEEVYLSEEDEDEDQSVQDESVTRCTCGESHSVGLMVQCDQCEVWQHCECMGLMEEQDIPEQYYCEQCRPSDHIELKVDFETRRYYKPALPSDFEKKLALPKRRSTFNSREASNSWVEILALQDAIERSKKESSSPELPTLQDFKDVETLQDFDDDMDAEVPSRPQKRPVKKQKLNNNSNNNNSKKATTVVEKKVKTSARKTTTTTRQKKARSRTSTPQPERAATPAAAAAAPLCEYVRETSPPAKVHYPSPRMTIPEMNKRANQLLEIVFAFQIEMGAAGGQSESDSDEHRRGRRPTPILIPEKMDDSSSLSSASTIPLEESDALMGDKGVAQDTLDRMQHQDPTSIQMMHFLTSDLLNFKRRFGSSGYDDNSAESECGPTTRSRELSHRSFIERAW